MAARRRAALLQPHFQAHLRSHRSLQVCNEVISRELLLRSEMAPWAACIWSSIPKVYPSWSAQGVSLHDICQGI